ncbi:MAG: autotransporter-associated beta strand repeat-containing protein [Chthoniobacteraceae bacterium]
MFQVTGGTFTENDTTNGIVIGKGSATVAASGELLVTGGTTTTPKISFGLNGGLAGSYGNLTLNGANANLYVGSGGIVNNATNTYTLSIALTNGTIGATADWSSSLAMTLGSGITIKAADASNVAHNITLTGVLGGTGGVTKTGGGTVSLSAANTYSGTTTVNAGTLQINGLYALGGANYGGLTLNGGTLKYATAFSGNGSGDVTSATTAKTLNIGSSGGTVDLNANSVTYANAMTGTGALVVTDSTGGGNLTLSGANTNSGGVTVNAGTLTIGTTGTAGTGNVTLANATGVTLTLQNSNAIADSAILTFGTNSVINLNDTGAGTETIAGLYDSATSTLFNTPGTYTATQLNTQFGVTSFTSSNGQTITIAVVPEPSVGVMLLGGAGLLGMFKSRRRSL